VTIQGVRTLHLLYSDGVRTGVRFRKRQSPAARSVRAITHQAKASRSFKPIRGIRSTIISSGRRRSNYALVGDMPLDELQKIAGSI